MGEISRIVPSLGKSVISSFSDVGRAPRILIPRVDEVVVSPNSYLKGCPVQLPNSALRIVLPATSSPRLLVHKTTPKWC